MPINLPVTDYTENQLRARITGDAQINFSDGNGATAVTYDVVVPPGYRVDEVGSCVMQAFDGTGVLLTAGDATTAAGYLTNANIALGTAASAGAPAVKRSSGIANALQFGAYYPTGGVIRFTFTQGTTPSVGIVRLFWSFTNPAKDGVPPSATQLTQL